MNSAEQANDRGAVTPFFAVVLVGLFIAAGLAIDGSAKVDAMQLADGYAAEAARSAGQAINVSDAVQGNKPTINQADARRAADAYLKAAGVTGTTRFTSPTMIEVETTITAPTMFLALIGISEFEVTGHASARLLPGISEVEQ